MFERVKVRTLVIAALLASGAMTGTALAQRQSAQTQESGAPEDNHVQQVSVPIIVYVDQNGQISREDWTRATTEKFDALDTNKTGYINVSN